MSKQLTKLDYIVIALFVLGALLAVTSMLMPPMGAISPSVVSVFAMCAILMAVVLAIQSDYTLEIRIGEHKYISWHPAKQS